MSRRIARENKLIERLANAIRFLGCGPDSDDLTGEVEWDDEVAYGYGYAGEGWYLVCSTYPEEGAEFIAPDQYGALLVAQAIVNAERFEMMAELALARMAYRASKAVAQMRGEVTR